MRLNKKIHSHLSADHSHHNNSFFSHSIIYKIIFNNSQEVQLTKKIIVKKDLTKKSVNVYQQIESMGSLLMVNLLNFLLDCCRCCCCCCCGECVSHSFVIVRTTGDDGDDGVDGIGESVLFIMDKGRFPLGRFNF